MKFSLFAVLLFTLISCSRKTDVELLHDGEKAYQDKKFELAVNLYQQIVDRSPATAYAESAQYRIAAIYSNDIHDPRKALRAYQSFYEKFPNSPDAPTSLFLEGFLFNNELHLTDSAREVYTKFVQKYPNHSLAESARFELETLGKDPGQYLQSKSALDRLDSASSKSEAK